MIDGRWCQGPRGGAGWSHHLTICVLITQLGATLGSLHGRIAPEAPAGAEERPLHSRVPAASLRGNYTCDARYVFDKPHLPPDSKRRDLAITMVGSTTLHAAGARARVTRLHRRKGELAGWI